MLAVAMRLKGWVDAYDCLIILPPQSEELLSSWLTRLAFAHGYSLATFISLFLRRDGSALSRTDIDFKEELLLFEKLAQKSGLAYEELFRMSLRSQEGYLFESDHGPNPPNHIRKLKDRRTHYGLMFCPQCLLEDQHPYWRKQWRYRFCNACPKHRIFLTVGIDAIEWFEEGLKRGYFTIGIMQVRSLFVFHAYTIWSWLLIRGESLQLRHFPMLDDYKLLCRKEQHYHSSKARPIDKDFYLSALVYHLFQNHPERLKHFASDSHLTH